MREVSMGPDFPGTADIEFRSNTFRRAKLLPNTGSCGRGTENMSTTRLGLEGVLGAKRSERESIQELGDSHALEASSRLIRLCFSAVAGASGSYRDSL
jgi:hypothetical protein